MVPKEVGVVAKVLKLDSHEEEEGPTTVEEEVGAGAARGRAAGPEPPDHSGGEAQDPRQGGREDVGQRQRGGRADAGQEHLAVSGDAEEEQLVVSGPHTVFGCDASVLHYRSWWEGDPRIGMGLNHS
jgi:hypothetical protein